jgi:hypothetical protein
MDPSPEVLDLDPGTAGRRPCSEQQGGRQGQDGDGAQQADPI